MKTQNKKNNIIKLIKLIKAEIDSTDDAICMADEFGEEIDSFARKEKNCGGRAMPCWFTCRGLTDTQRS